MNFLQKWLIVAILPLVMLQQHATVVVMAQQEGGGLGGGSTITKSNTANTNTSLQNKDATQSQQAKVLFTKMDSNHDSSLSLDEFTTNFSLLQNNNMNKGSSSSSGTGISNGTGSSNGYKSNARDGFWNGFSSSTMMIIATEIGDKTFFIAAVLSMRNSRLLVFGGAISALICMTVLR